MPKVKKSHIQVQGALIAIESEDGDDYICLTDMVRNFEGGPQLIYRWMRNRNTLEFLGIWESLHNPSFNPIEFDRFKKDAGLNSFTMNPKKWIEGTNAVGIRSRAGRHDGGIFAHRDIAFEFGTWLNPGFKLMLIKEFQRLKEDETRRQSLEWSTNRVLSKLNYRVHTDAIKEHLSPQLSKEEERLAYASEADMLNVALFGTTASQWKKQNPHLDGNLRDNASVEQLLVMANLEQLNAHFISVGHTQKVRLQMLRAEAIKQLERISRHASTLSALKPREPVLSPED